MSADPLLRTPRMLLRRFTEHDAGALLAVDADPEVVRWAHRGFFEQPPDLAHIRARRLPAILAGYREDPPREQWAALERPGGAFLGFFFLHPRGDSWELGYRLRQSAWGRGLATEGAAEVMRYGFETARAERIVASVVAENRGSLRVVEKLGMRYVGSSDWHGFEDRLFERRRA